MTLRGYSVALVEETEHPPSSPAKSETRAPTPPSQIRGENRSLQGRDNPTRPQWPIGDGLGLRPSSLAARQALAGLAKASSNIDQHLALIEMLIAVGPEVREERTLHESLRALKKLEDEIGQSVADLVKACDDVRADGPP